MPASSSRLDSTPIGVARVLGRIPGVAFALLRQPRSEIRNTLGVGIRNRFLAKKTVQIVLPSLLFLQPLLAGEPVRFPKDAGVLDITAAPYNAIANDGKDDTAAIQKAIADASGKNRIVYLPDGTYDLRQKLRWKDTGGGISKRTILQGESQQGAVLLFDNPQVKDGDVIRTGGGAAQNFRNSLRDFTLRIAPGNSPKLNGIRFVANNQGTMRNVTIESLDGKGDRGLNLWDAENGPLLVSGVRVVGFDYGIVCGNQTASQTLEDIRLEDQRLVGIEITNQSVFIRGLSSRSQAVVVKTVKNSSANVTLVDALLEGCGAAEQLPAIFSDKNGYFRNITATGYERTIKHDDKGRGNTAGVTGNYAGEFLSHGPAVSAFKEHAGHGLGLELRHPPEIPWGDLEKWAGPHQFGGIPDDKKDDTTALQAAFDSGAQTVYLPNGTWRIDGEVKLAGKASRLIGCEATIEGKGSISIGDGDAAAVKVERIQFAYGGDVQLVQDTARTVVLEALTDVHYVAGKNAGDLYLDDVVGTPFHFKKQRVWARQLNQENDVDKETHHPAKVLNEGGDLWVLGLKTERAGIAVKTIDRGRTEMLGAFLLGTGKEKGAAFSTVDSSASFAGMALLAFDGSNYPVFASEKRDGKSLELPLKNSAPVLYCAFEGSTGKFVPDESDTEIVPDEIGLDTFKLPESEGGKQRIVGAVGSVGLQVSVSEGKLEIKSAPGSTGKETVVIQTTDGKGRFARHVLRVKRGK